MQLVELNLYRGPRPKNMVEVKGAGIENIISLESGIFDLFHNDDYERQFACDYGLKQYCLKCSDIWPPSKWARDKAIEIILRGRPTLVHCAKGKDRTGLIVMDYRLRIDNWPWDRAYKEWVDMGRHIQYDWWKYSLRSR